MLLDYVWDFLFTTSGTGIAVSALIGFGLAIVVNKFDKGDEDDE